MSDPHRQHLHWSSALRIGSHTLPATLFLTLPAALCAGLAGPLLSFIFGTGVLPAVVISLSLFFILVVFRKILFKNIYKYGQGDGDTALLEYLVQHNNTGQPGEEEAEMELLENALHLKKIQAWECMAPLDEIVHVDVRESVDKLRELFIDSSLSRIIVTEGGLGKVLGYVHVQQMFDRPRSIIQIVMPIAFVAKQTLMNELLTKFIKNRTNIACVIDEAGEVAGLVSLEDVLEQLFGDIDDEHDEA